MKINHLKLFIMGAESITIGRILWGFAGSSSFLLLETETQEEVLSFSSFTVHKMRTFLNSRYHLKKCLRVLLLAAQAVRVSCTDFQRMHQ